MHATLYLLLFAAILVVGVSGGEYCPGFISTFCFGSLPYCCGSASAPSSLHCCDDCMYHYENPCLLSEQWVIVIAVIGGVVLVVVIGALVYLWCRSRHRVNNYKQLDNYNSILATSQPPTGTFALQQRPQSWQPYGSVAMANQSPAYVPEVYSYVQAHPKMYSYGTVGSDDKELSAPSAPYANESV